LRREINRATDSPAVSERKAAEVDVGRDCVGFRRFPNWQAAEGYFQGMEFPAARGPAKEWNDARKRATEGRDWGLCRLTAIEGCGRSQAESQEAEQFHGGANPVRAPVKMAQTVQSLDGQSQRGNQPDQRQALGRVWADGLGRGDPLGDRGRGSGWAHGPLPRSAPGRGPDQIAAGVVMPSLSPATRISVALQPVDMGAGFNRRYAPVETRLNQEPLCGHLVVLTTRVTSCP